MEIKRIESHDGIPITYYKMGEGPQRILIANAPGMSIKFWIPIIQILSKEFTILAVDYRGFPNCEVELPEDKCSFDHMVSDFLKVIEAEQYEQFHCLSWCLGSKIILGIREKMKNAVQSVITLNSAHKKLDLENQGKFTGLLLQIKEKVEKDPSAIKRMIKIIDQVGIIPSQDFLSLINEEEDDDGSSSLDLYDLLESESPLASLAFYMINTPNALKTYLKMYVQFGYFEGEKLLKDVDVPFVLLTGSEDTIVEFDYLDFELFDANPQIRVTDIDGGSHFMIVEYPKKIARLIYEGLQENLALIGQTKSIPLSQ